MQKSLRAYSVGFSVSLHASIVLLAIFWAQIAPLKEVPVPLYTVDLVTLPGAPGKIGPTGDPSPGPVAPEPEPPGPAAPAKPAPPDPAPKPAAQEPAPVKPTPPPPKPEPAKPEPSKPEVKPLPKPVEPPPPPQGKDIAAKKEDNLKKPEPKPKEPEKKVEPQPQPTSKPDPKAKDKNYVKTDPDPKKKNQAPTREQILAQALESAQKDSAKEDKAGRDALSKELAQLRDSVGRHSGPGGTGSGSAAGTGAGGGGEGGGGGSGGPDVAYLRAISQMIKEHWSYPKFTASHAAISQVEITLDASGRILEYRLISSSGKDDYDASTIKAIVETQQEETLPPPPKGLRVIRINFNSQELK